MKSKNKLVLGVGINDAEYKVQIFGKEIESNKLKWICPFYIAWKNMLTRAYSKSEHERLPRYAECRVDSAWLLFSTFRNWMIEQPWQGNQLDKDIIIQGNTLYSPENCAFVSADLNKFMNDHGSARGKWPIGVSRDKRSKRFSAKCSNPFSGKRDVVGYFDCPEEAHEAWRRRKHDLACQYAAMQTDPRLSHALITRYAKQEG